MRDLEDDLGPGGGLSGAGGGGGTMETKAVGDLPERLQLVQTDVFAIKEHLGPKADPYNTFFVDVKHGDYAEVWGVHSAVPHNAATAYRIV